MLDRNSIGIALAALALTGLLVGCSSDDVVDPNGGNNALDALAGDQFAIPDGMDVVASVEAASLDNPMVMNATFDSGPFHRHHAFPNAEGSHVGTILRDLGITEDQMWQIADLVRSHFDNVREQLEGIRSVNQPLIDQANALRDAIVQAYRNGELTMEEAWQQLRELNEATREAIRNNPANEPFFAAICDSKRALFDAIRDVLDAEQQAVWDAWVSGLTGSCLGSEA